MKNSLYEPLSALYSRLNEAGFAPSFVRKYALPSWWRDSQINSESGVALAQGFIARHLGLDVAALLRGEVVCAENTPVRHKKNLGANENKMEWASCLAVRAARLAIPGAVPTMNPAKDGAPPTAKSLRNFILREAPTVSLGTTLSLCWDLGIPVVPVTEFPVGTHKMDGLAVTLNGRGAIVLSKKHRFSAPLLFVLAHELGHVLLGHCGDNGISMDKGQLWSENEAQCELEADRFAIELLTGDAETAYTSDLWLTSQQLADVARQMSGEARVDPGVIALNYAWSKDFLQVGQGALKLLEPNGDAMERVRQTFEARLKFDRLTEEAAHYLQRLTHTKIQAGS